MMISTRFTRLDEAFANTRNRLDFGYKMDGTAPGHHPPSSTHRHSRSCRASSTPPATTFSTSSTPTTTRGLLDPGSWNKMPRAGYVFEHRRQAGYAASAVAYRRRPHQTHGPRGRRTKLDRITVGGKAPEILNQVIEWGANFAVQLLLNAIALTWPRIRCRGSVRQHLLRIPILLRR